MGISMKKILDPLIIWADQIDVITNFDVITNVVIKRVHCSIMTPNTQETNIPLYWV